MDAALADELRALRARAYGRDADLAHDSEAMRRLRELEVLQAASTSVGAGSTPRDPGNGADAVQEAEPSGDAEGGLGPLFDLSADDVAPLEPDAPREDAVAPTDRGRRRRTAFWIASLVASAALASAIAYGITEITPVATSSGSPQIATLLPVGQSGALHGLFGSDEDAPMFEFFGMSLFPGTGAGWSGQGGECLHALATEHVPAPSEVESGSWGIDGPIYSGCGAGAFPTALTLPLDAEVPAELREQFPDGTALQFVLDGDRIGVFLDSE